MSEGLITGAPKRKSQLPSERVRAFLDQDVASFAKRPTSNESRIDHGHPETPHLRTIPGLDGIRGLSVAAVVCFHAGIAGAGGLYMGVDGFFVLSGYLITSLLIGDVVRNGSVSFASFWSRRARRLLPALFALIAVVLFVEAFWGDPLELPTVRGDAIAALFYSSNWYYIWTHLGYFGQSQALSPLQHTWSLAIEEQFYIVWPILFAVVIKWRKSIKPMIYVAGIGAILSAGAMALVYGSGQGLDQAYYGTETRAQALLVGATLAFLLSIPNIGRDSRVVKASAAGGPLAFLAIVILWSQASGPPAWMFRGGFFLSDILVALVIASVVLAPRRLFNEALSMKPLRALGKISYGLYLWQFPIVIMFNNARTGFSGIGLFALRTFISILMAIVSYYLVEQPVRLGAALKKRAAWLVTPAVAAVMFAFALIIGTLTPTVNSQALVNNHALNAPQVPISDPIRVLLVGDSIAETLGQGASYLDSTDNVNLSDSAIIGCGTLTGGLVMENGSSSPQGGDPVPCSQWASYYSQRISDFHPDVTVMLAGRWETLDRNWGNGWEHIGQSDFDNRLMASLKQAISVLTQGGAPLVLLTAPYYSVINPTTGTIYPEDNTSRVDLYNSMLRQAAQGVPNVQVLDFNSLMDPNGQYAEYINGLPIRQPDGIHITNPVGGEWIADWLYPKLINIGLKYRQQNG